MKHNMSRVKQSLNGMWDYRVGKGFWEKREVPYSALPVGESECRLHFDRVSNKKRAFLIFEGITYAASVTLNDHALGDMLPYCEYRFEVSDLLKDSGNELTVTIRDIDPVFGPSEGWENYGGIIRPVYLEYTSADFISDVVWSAQTSDDFTSAVCHIRAQAELTTPGAVLKYTLTDFTGKICAVGEIDDGSVSFELCYPFLWSPDHPHLYTLSVSVYADGCELDCDCRKVGIKSLVTRGKRFYLNGKPLFLVGVCRHDTWGDSGHTMSQEQMMQDMQLIKAQGVNYVRLVHYPHNKRIVEIADEIGLLISEEPGLWWSDMTNEALCRDSLEVLRRTVIRDRSNVSVAFWLAFNECIFTAEFIRDSGRICRENDPTRLVSGANCMSIEMTKEFFHENGFDFYTMHPYGDNTKRMWDSVTKLDDKPLVFTEWGGYTVWQNDDLFARFISEMVSMWRNTEDKPVLTGAAIWCWADMFEFSRREPACHDGVLCEGLVDRYRNPHSHFAIFKREFKKLDSDPEPEFALSPAQFGDQGRFRTISLHAENYDAEKAWEGTKALCDEKIDRYYYEMKRTRHIIKGPVLPKPVAQLGSVPFDFLSMPLIADQTGVTVELNVLAQRLIILGNASLPYGYPVRGAYGEPAAVYEITYNDGSTESHVLRNGYEVTTAFSILGPSRIDPRAANAPRALAFSYDYDSEHYVINRLDVKTDPCKTAVRLTIRTLSDTYRLLTYAVTAVERDS